MANNIANQTKNAQVNSFTGGINTDLHPMLQPNNTLTDCVNGTLITYNGNENMLQNDMGNYALEGAKLPPNYVPIGVKEHAGILYVVAYNPLTKRTQIGSYPSPKVTFENPKEGAATVKIKPYKIKSISDSDGSFDPFEIMKSEKFTVDNQDGYHLYSNVIKTADGLLHLLGEMSQDEYQLTINDQYKIRIDINDEPVNFESYTDPWMQELKFYSVTKDGKIEDISDKIYNTETKGDFNNVTWESAGWIGVKYELVDVVKSSQTITNVKYPRFGDSVNLTWSSEKNDNGQVVATGNLIEGESFFEDPFIMIPEEDVYYKHYWKNEFPSRDNEVIYYANHEWELHEGVDGKDIRTDSDPTGFHRIVFNNLEHGAVEDISTLFNNYSYSSEEDYLYVFLPKFAKIDETKRVLFGKCKIHIFVHEESSAEFIIKSDLDFLNIPKKSKVTSSGIIKELYCSNDVYSHNIAFNKIGYLITNDIIDIKKSQFRNIITNSKVQGIYTRPFNPQLVAENKTCIFYKTVDGNKCEAVVFQNQDIEIESNERYIDDYFILKFNKCVKTLNWNLFQRSKNNLTYVEISPGVCEIKNTFQQCLELETVVLPDTIKKLDGAFIGSTKLKTVHIKDLTSWCNIEIVNSGVPFYSSRSGDILLNGTPIKNLEIPLNVRTLSDFLFWGVNIETLVVPKTVEKIGVQTFDQCSNLKTVILNDETQIENNSFGGIDVEIYDVKNNCIYYISDEKLEIDFGVNHTFSNNVGQINFDLDLTTIEANWFSGSSIKSIILPDSITRIEKQALSQCPNLHQLYIPDDVLYIEESAFEHSNIHSLYIGESVNQIENNAFYCDVPSISEVHIKSLESWFNIDFANESSTPFSHTWDDNQVSLYINGELSTEIDVPDTIVVLKPYTFYSCDFLTLNAENINSFRDYSFASKGGTIVLGNSRTMTIDNHAFDGTTVISSPEIYYDQVIDKKVDTGIWKFIHTNVYVPGTESTQWLNSNGELTGFDDSESVKYILPKSWSKKSGFEDTRITYDNGNIDLKNSGILKSEYRDDIINRYVYNILSVTDSFSDNIIGWNQNGNSIQIFANDVSDLDEIDITLEMHKKGVWEFRQFSPYKQVNFNGKNLFVQWFDNNNQPIEFNTADPLEFTVNSEIRIPENIWEKYDINEEWIRCQFLVIGETSDGIEYSSKFVNNNNQSFEKRNSTNFSEVSSNITFKDCIPPNLDKIEVSSVFYCDNPESGQKLILDQTFQTDVIEIPTYVERDLSNVNLLTFKYEVAKESSETDYYHKMQFTVQFSEAVRAEDIYCVLRDTNSDLVYTSKPKGELYSFEQHFEFPNIDSKVQFAKLEIRFGGKLKFNETVMLNTIVNEYSDSNNMQNLQWNKLIDEIIKDEDNEWKLNISIDVDKENITTVPCAYKLNDNGEMVDIQKWTKDTIPANVIPIVDEDGFIPRYDGQTFADLVYAPVKIIVTLGHGVKINGNFSNINVKFKDGSKISNSDINQVCVGKNEIVLNKSEQFLTSIPQVKRATKCLYKPLGLKTWGDFSDDELSLLESYWNHNNGLLATVCSDDNVYLRLFKCDVSNFSQNTHEVHVNKDLLEQMPLVFPIKFQNDTDWHGFHRPIYLGPNTEGFDTWTKTGGVGRKCWNVEGRQVTNSYTNGGNTLTCKMQDCIFSICDKGTDFYTLGINCGDHIRYSWFKYTPLWTKDELINFEKELFLIALMTVVSSDGLLLPGSQNHFKASVESKHITSIGTDMQIVNARCSFGELSNINISTQVEMSNLTSDDCLYNNLEEKLNGYGQSTNEINNAYVSSFYNMIKYGVVNTKDVDFTYKESAILHYGYYGSTYPKYFVPVYSTNPLLMADRGEKQVRYEALGYTNNIESTDSFVVNADYLEQWSVVSENDIFNQLHNKFIVEGKLTLNIGNKTETKTIDQWLQYFLKVLLKELKYERDYNNTLKQKI